MLQLTKKEQKQFKNKIIMKKYFLVKSKIEGMKCTMADYEIASITETKILDVFNYKAE